MHVGKRVYARVLVRWHHMCLYLCAWKKHSILKLVNNWCGNLCRMGWVSPEFMTPVCVTAEGLCRSHKHTDTHTHCHLSKGEERDKEWKGINKDRPPLAADWPFRDSYHPDCELLIETYIHLTPSSKIDAYFPQHNCLWSMGAQTVQEGKAIDRF